MYLQSLDKVECCGCTACSSICPQNVIDMVSDEEGFEYPIITHLDRCIKCGLCRKVCPFNNNIKPSHSPKCFVGFSKHNKIRFDSTSGGAFTAIAESAHFLGYNIFYGAGFDGAVVRYMGVNYDHIGLLRGTKYVQSSPGKMLKEIKDIITSERKVMVVGTPCQLQAIISFLGEAHRNKLLAVSLVCHGTSSPAAFEKYCAGKYSTVHGKISKIIFRDKIKDEITNEIKSETSMIYVDGYKYSEEENFYTTCYGLGLMQRQCCEKCPYTTIYRNTDITIGDFWGIENQYPEMLKEKNNGISLILTHSKAGQNIISNLKDFYCEEVPVQWALNDKQPQLLAPHPCNPRRNKFMKKILANNNSFDRVAKSEVLRWRIEKKLKFRK